ncbi:MAG TPA: hypothetical protein VFN68_07075 [Acidimicrobiales bacterium]|nr:hypothetical protein [Acidimicrobiales bacterium]
MRSSIADYEVVEMLAGPPDGPRRFLCRAPGRLAWSDPVEVIEVPVDDSRFAPWSDWVARVAAAGGEDLRVLLEAGPDPDGWGGFVSCEAAPGGSLGHPELDAGAAPPDPVDAVAGAARGAHALHEVGLAHGSISPSSIFLTARRPVLGPPRLDAPDGLAIGAAVWEDLQCVDPDLLRGEAPSRSSDIWSLGATLHMALTGRALYPGLAEDQAVTAVQRVMFTRPEIDPSIDEGLRRLIARCLEPDPSLRPENADEVARELATRQVRP